LFINRWKPEMDLPFVMGVGGTLDVVAGRVRRAPRWMQQTGFEWLFRLVQEPRRMWRRYLVEDMEIFKLIWREWRKTKSK
jgi:N-acetylglucosaminyldiphosphoundecaprenol N-acetyl-beta-D-mannosaminyltransferase